MDFVRKAGNALGARCFIVGAGEFTGHYSPGEDDYVIAADAGFPALVSRGVTPDLVVGDFDSLGFTPEHPNVVLCAAEKDDTDMMLAVRQGLSRGYRSFVIDGGTDGRLDHTLANFQILSFLAENGARGVLLGRDMCAAAVRNGSLRFLSGGSGYVSVFCAGERARGVSLSGLKFPLHDAELTFVYPLGVSNEFTGESAAVSVLDGSLIVIWAGGPELLAEGE